MLDVLAWGGDPDRLDWFEPPAPDALAAATTLLARLGAVADGRLTPVGVEIQRLPLHPRLARMLLAGGGARDLARAAAIVSERHFLPPRAAATTSDLLSALDDWPMAPPHVQRVAKEIEGMASALTRGARAMPLDEREFRRAVLAAYPDRVAVRRQPRSPEVLLASGTGAVVSEASGVREGEFLVAVDVHESAGGPGASRGPRGSAPQALLPVVGLASRVEREWLRPTSSDVVHRFDRASGHVRAERVDRYDAIVLAEHPLEPDPLEAARLLADAWLERGPDEDDARLLRRLASRVARWTWSP